MNTEIIPASEVDDSKLRNAESVELAFQPFRLTLEELTRMATGLEVTGVHELEKMEAAKKLDKDFLALEKAVEARHKERKEYFLVNGRKVDSARRAILDEIEPIRKWLKAQASFRELEEARIRKALHEERMNEMLPFGVVVHPACYGSLSDEDYAQIRSDAKAALEWRLAREKEIEDARLAKEEEDRLLRLEAERLRVENARLENERILKEKETEARLREEREKVEAEQRAKAAVEAEERRKVEAAAAEIQRKKDEAARVERERLAEEQRVKDEAAATALREEQEKAAALQRAADEEKARKLSEEEEKRKAEEAAANAPDNEKIMALYEKLIAIVEDESWSLSQPEKEAHIVLVIKTAADNVRAFIQ